jgi:hypothetical protein
MGNERIVSNTNEIRTEYKNVYSVTATVTCSTEGMERERQTSVLRNTNCEVKRVVRRITSREEIYGRRWEDNIKIHHGNKLSVSIKRNFSAK